MNNLNETKTSDNEPKIIEREKSMVDAMILIYCRSHHGFENAPCPKCFEFGVYAKDRIGNCHYGEKKPACGHCGLTCFDSKGRGFGELVFNYSGPRMLFEEPRLALYHLWYGFRNAKHLKK